MRTEPSSTIPSTAATARTTPTSACDKELTSFSAHRVSLELSRNFETDGGTQLRTVLLAAPTYYSYRDFLPLDHILAVELTLALEVTL